ncbi:rRNA maturation protein Nop10 [Sphingomonas vulcanisoli]|uniref:rRNA maturation protein Nop10 n=1 Tax=Sphingomonas vulcanisoli TaxID=1658060 RepID=A0ABX0TNT8_9SPHN|nr:hypothetical protein [Sphingomonas vulcanisoli]NIJ07192.1 rRNA maturation protein Nop10 [Sphingomonas vulcanisoli]
MSRPINIDVSNWAPFNPSDPHDAMCERERQAFTAYTLKRLQKCPKTGSDETAIWTGGLMSIVQIIFAQHENLPPEAARDALHQALDFAWLQCSTIFPPAEGMN